MSNSLFGIGRELKTTRFPVAGNVSFEARLVDRDIALIQAIDLCLVDVATNNVVAHFGHAGTRDEAYVAGTEYC